MDEPMETGTQVAHTGAGYQYLLGIGEGAADQRVSVAKGWA